MNELARQIGETIRREGPISIERFWTLALFDRRHGYYTTRAPFGRSGDFVTAPEVSQMFGELLGAWLVAAWRALGAPAPFTLAEIGPGRGTLMADILRTVRSLDMAFLKAARISLVEVSDRLAGEQLAALERFDLPVRRVRRLEEIEPGPLLLVANELFDAVPIRQFVFDGAAWRERCIAVGDRGRFSYVLRPLQASAGLQRPLGGLPPPSAGATLEVSPDREALAAGLGRRLAADGGAALVIDYGHAEPGYGDTLQAIREHAFADPLDRPGEIDITSHVDFASLARQLARAGLVVPPPMEQGSFLFALGLRERAGALGAGRSTAEQAGILAAARRLAGTGPTEMGRLFKVLAAASKPLPLPPFGAPRLD